MVVFHMKCLNFSCFFDLQLHGMADITAGSFYFFQNIVTCRNPFKIFRLSICNPVRCHYNRWIIFRVFYSPLCRCSFCFLQVVAWGISDSICRILPPGLIKSQMGPWNLTIAVSALWFRCLQYPLIIADYIYAVLIRSIRFHDLDLYFFIFQLRILHLFCFFHCDTNWKSLYIPSRRLHLLHNISSRNHAFQHVCPSCRKTDIKRIVGIFISWYPRVFHDPCFPLTMK